MSDLDKKICSGVLDDPHYSTLAGLYLDAWYKFVPHQSQMDASNCWRADNFNPLPTEMTDRLKSLHNFHGFQIEYSEAEIDSIFGKLFNRTQAAIFPSERTQHHFCLPNLNLIGFPKTGSTFFYEYIKLHPLFGEPHTKEGHLWMDIMEIKDRKYIEFAILLYLYRFGEASREILAHPAKFTIDGSVSTVYATSKPLGSVEKDICLVPLLISKVMPRMKILVQTRHPVDRLWSDFLFFCPPEKWEMIQKSSPTPSELAWLFHNYTLAAIQEFRGCIEAGHTQFHCTALAGSYAGPDAACRVVRIGVSMYYLHLVKWFNVFPQEQLHVIRLEDLAADPDSTMQSVWEFLDLPPQKDFRTIDHKVKANKWSSRSEGHSFKMLPKTRRLLEEFYHPYNIKLAQLLNDERFIWT